MIIKFLLVLISLISLSRASFTVACKQEQRPLPVLKTGPLTSLTTYIQTATPFVVNATASEAGKWNSGEVFNAARRVVGLTGSDSVSGVSWFSFEPAGSRYTSAQSLVQYLTGFMIGGNGWTFQSYVDWSSCTAGAGSVNTQIGTYLGYSTSASGQSLLQTFAAAFPYLDSATSTITFTGGDTTLRTTWDVALVCTHLPVCNLPGLVNTVARALCTISVVPSVFARNNALHRESSFFAWKDLQLGQATATSKHILAPYCDFFLSNAPKPLDVLFSVDNSGSMAAWQAAVAGLGTAIANILGNTGIDWRIGLVTSAHYLPYSTGACIAKTCGETGIYTCRYFSRDINVVQSWLTSGNTRWVGAGGTCGTGTEKALFSLKMMLTSPPAVQNGAQSFMPRTPITNGSLAPIQAFRQATNGLLIILGDADDQDLQDNDYAGIAAYLNFFLNLRTQFNDGLFMCGIICPAGSLCSEVHRTPRVIRSVLTQYPGAVIGDITSVQTIQNTVQAAFNNIVAQSSPYILTQPSAVAASLQLLQSASKVLGPCNNSNNEVPRSRVNGFDIEQNRIILFGGCRPSSNGQPIVANYYYWVLTQCGDGIVQGDGSDSGEQCEPAGGVSSATDCCDDNCRFITDPGFACVPPAGTSCGTGNQSCNSGVCTSSSCPDYCEACGETAPNFCTVSYGCTNNVCVYRNRTCLPLGCDKRVCDRNTPNSLIPGLMGECIRISFEQGYLCDTDFCVVDACGWCNGDNTTCVDCTGKVPAPGQVAKQLDICGVCGGSGESCCSCRPGESTICSPFAPKNDACGVCDGDGRSCVPCDQTTLVNGFNLTGTQGLDTCGVCFGDGSSCLPTFDIQVNFPKASYVDACTSVTPTQYTAPCTSTGSVTPCSCPTSPPDRCCEIEWSFTQALTCLGYTVTEASIQCSPIVDACDPTTDLTGTCVCDIDPACPNPGRCCDSYLIEIQQVLFDGTTFSTPASLINLLQTSGQLLTTNSPFALSTVAPISQNPAPLLSACYQCTTQTSSTVASAKGYCCNQGNCISSGYSAGMDRAQCEANPGASFFTSASGICPTNACQNLGTTTTQATTTTTTQTPGSGVTPTAVLYTFPTYSASQLSPLQQQALIQQTIIQLVAQGVLTLPLEGYSFYTGTIIDNGDGTLTVQVFPATTSTNPTGAYPGGATTPPPSTPGVVIVPPLCSSGLCSGRTVVPPSTSKGLGKANDVCECTDGATECQTSTPQCEPNLLCSGGFCRIPASANALVFSALLLALF